MHCKILSIDNSSDRQLIKDIHDCLVALNIVTDEHLLPEIVPFSAVSRLMVPSEEINGIWVAHFEPKEESKDLGLVLSAIDIVTQKQKLLVRASQLDLPQNLYQVIELPVDVTDDDHSTVGSQHIGLSMEHCLRFLTDGHESRFCNQTASILEVHNRFCVGGVGTLTSEWIDGEHTI